MASKGIIVHGAGSTERARDAVALTKALMIMGTVMGKMKSGTVSWLNSARPENTFSGVSEFSSSRKCTPNVTSVTRIEEAWVKNAKTKNRLLVGTINKCLSLHI
jgi:hypothetical protein